MEEATENNFSDNGHDKSTLTIDDLLTEDPPKPPVTNQNYNYNQVPFDLYKRIGFQIATETMECPEEKFKGFLGVHEAKNNTKNDAIEAVSEFNIQRYEEKIEKGREWMNEKYNELTSPHPGLEPLLAERKNLETALDNKKIDLYQKLEEFFREKKVLLKTRLEELKLEIQDARTTIKQVYTDKRDLLTQFSADCGQIFNEKINWLKELKEKLRTRYEQLQEELKANDLRGMGPALFNFLIALGATGALVAGWFFSVYINAENSPHYENMTFSQVISNLMNFSAGIDWWWPLLALASFLVIVYYISKKMKRRYNKEKMKEKEKGITEDEEIAEDNENWEWTRAGIYPLSAKFKAKNWYYFWLKITPWIFVVGILLILMSYSAEGGKFGGSLTGEAIGFLVCIAFSGAAYIYVANKNKRNTEENRSARLEITILFFAFILFNITIGVFLLTSKGFIERIGYQQFKQFFALINFILVMTITTLIIGYGHYYKGIVSLSSFLNWKINKVDEQIRKKSNVNWLEEATRLAGKRSDEITESLVNITSEKANDLRTYFASDSHVATVLHPNAEELSYPCLSEPDVRIFPEYDLMVRNLIFQCVEEVRRRNEIDREIKEISDQQKQDHQAAIEMVNIYNNRIHQWNNEIIEEKYELIERLTVEGDRFLWEQTQLKDGYNLGLVYRKHNGAKMEDHFQPCPPQENKTPSPLTRDA